MITGIKRQPVFLKSVILSFFAFLFLHSTTQAQVSSKVPSPAKSTGKILAGQSTDNANPVSTTGKRIASLGVTGDPTDVKTKTSGGVALIGGGGDVEGAFKWMIDRSGGGNVVVIRASGDYLYNETIYKLGKVRSVETLRIDSRELANNEEVARVIRNAEMLFISGGDQSNYMNFWRGTKTNDAINYLLNVKKVPVGGTSAGCAILTGLYYSGEGGSATAEILKNPYDTIVKLYNNDFLKPPYLRQVLSDQHYIKRNRPGRHVTFLSRIITDWHIFPKGIAPDEKTAVCIDEKGQAQVFGAGKAYFLLTDPAHAPESCQPGKPLQWMAGNKAIKVYELQGTETGNGSFSVADFSETKANGGKWSWWWVDKGELVKEGENGTAAIITEGAPAKTNTESVKYVMAIHGGAGTLLKKNMTPEKEAAYRDGLQKALEKGYSLLKEGKSGIEAVEATIRILEDNPLFNAGKGSVFTHDGHNEMDAAIMNGKTLAAGAVAGVRTIRNPITAARAVMERSEHVLLTGAGAEQFAKEAGLEFADPSYFRTGQRWQDLQQALKEDSLKTAAGQPIPGRTPASNSVSDPQATINSNLLPNGKFGTVNVDSKFGTVGCVALDKNGDLAAGTSTGGMTNKKYGRIGDSPLIGAGTYANNETVAVSCTGWGEFYIRSVVAHDLSALVEYKGLSVREAGRTVIGKMGRLGGDGGLIALDKNGHLSMPFNTEGMYRGCVTEDGKIEIYIYKD
ncbi:isoaspartyl peptidase/L-asparaginase [Flavitalea flava]